MEKKHISFDDSNNFIEKLIQGGVSYKASDIHISPGKNEVNVKFRISGELHTLYSFSPELHDKFINSIKVLSGMDISEHNHIQDGKIFMNLAVNTKQVGVNGRVSSLPTIYGENIVIRLLLTESNYLQISGLGFSENNAKLLKRVTSIQEGLVLVCGGTGSGKTTTLYALLNEFDPDVSGIFTLEDPIEYQIDGYVQSQIKTVKGSSSNKNSYTFSEGLVGILRQDPDVIMIGEIRRKEEAQTCLEAANTGHIVMGTIHSNNSISVVTRIRQLGIDSYLLASGIKYIISQKMIKGLCESCKVETKINKNTLPEIFQKYINDDIIAVFKNNPGGCEKCNKGYNGSVVLSEIAEIDDDIYDLLLSNAGETELKEALLKKGFIPFYIDALYKALEGSVNITDIIDLEY
ncbi:hypothetical protein A9Q91_03770 [Candidatus Gracilibacteria bacterium 28_42_T64]|nr:hypothetical protein A9Q91_03770 [Candidatus Gracilibacteria bacterium 28_42_T64]